MAKVGKESYSFGRFTGAIRFDFEVFFTKKDGFYIKVPEDILKYKQHPLKITGTTYDNAVGNATKYFNDFYTQGIEQSKVILYYLDWTCPRKFIGKDERSNWDNYGRGGLCRADLPFNSPVFKDGKSLPGYELRIDYKIKYLVTIGGQMFLTDNEVKHPNDLSGALKYKQSSGGSPYDNISDWKHMPYTEEAEKWFQQTMESLGKMIAIVVSFFGAEPQDLLKSIEKKKLSFNTSENHPGTH